MTHTLAYKNPVSRFYVLLILLLAGGGLMLVFSPSFCSQEHTLCLFKNITGIACPGCGMGRGVYHFFMLDFTSAFLLNPFSIPVAILAVLLPLWIVYDMATAKNTLYHYYLRLNNYFARHKPALVILLLLFAANWAWNIAKF